MQVSRRRCSVSKKLTDEEVEEEMLETDFDDAQCYEQWSESGNESLNRSSTCEGHKWRRRSSMFPIHRSKYCTMSGDRIQH